MYRWIAWNILFRAQEMAKGHPTYRILREMEAADRMSVSELEELRLGKLRSFLAYCHAHVPFVRSRMEQCGLNPDRIRDVGDLAALPLTTKSDIRQNRPSLRSDIAHDLVTFSTGGSTGEPLLFDLGKRRIASRVACRQRVGRWWGLSVGDREVALWGSPLELRRQDRLRALRDRFLATRLLSAYELDDATMSQYLDIFERERFRQVFAYPSAIYLLCLHARKVGRDLRHLGVKTIFVTSELLFPHQREVITDTFGCPVADGYGGRDSGFLAHECPRGGMHILADTVVLEVVDESGRPLPPGVPGEIVATDLYSHEAPFVRFATGDIGVLSDRQCSCGRSLPLLDRLEGRSNDSVVTPDGRIMHGQSLVALVMEIEGIDQFRVRQLTPERFHLQIVRNAAFREDTEARIRRTWEERLRSRLQITFEYPPAIPVEANGKLRYIVSDVSAGQDLRRPQAEKAQIG